MMCEWKPCCHGAMIAVTPSAPRPYASMLAFVVMPQSFANAPGAKSAYGAKPVSVSYLPVRNVPSRKRMFSS